MTPARATPNSVYLYAVVRYLGRGTWEEEARGWRLKAEAGSWRLEAGGWKLEARTVGKPLVL